MAREFEGRIALVTGASRGIGRAVALGLAEAGAHVIALARTVGGLEELDDAIRAKGGSASLVPLDLKDGDGIDKLAIALFERYQRLDILVGNAGILGSLSPLGHLEVWDWDATMAVNLTANFRLIRAMDPLLRRSEAGRAVFLTSGAAWKASPYWGLYATTKAALDALVMTYAAETETTAVRANLLSPGPIRTRMRAAAMPSEDPETLPTPETVVPAVLKLTSPGFTESGRLFDLKSGTLMAFQPPVSL
jgi:NAD(P)-dependent dehydrogenase (short-subunit alcohol dehydrogenase family)